MFEKIGNENGKVLLANGKEGEIMMLNGVRDFVQRIHCNLPKNRSYTLKNMHDREVWKRIDNGTRRMMGDCLAHLVATKQVPMVCLDKNSSNSLTYQFI